MLLGTVSLKERLVQPEILDGLSPESREARQARASLRRINFLMGNFGWFQRRLRAYVESLPVARPVRALELGAGDGTLARVLSQDPELAGRLVVTGLDQIPRPKNWPKDWGWVCGRIEEFAQWQDYSIVFGNLIAHHFVAEDLGRLGSFLGRFAHLLLFSEPLRALRSVVWLRLISPVLLDPVTRYDAMVSVRAGFQKEELPHFLGLPQEKWKVKVETTLWGAYRLEAVRV
ncbi:class I SAM-dependent methyltransferase [Candidatus Methylacidithermus pantelleriae]|uniref:Methyltransferase domain-containing protein n=1 Tax=Candidatus Methylacidithermus pantelleriae TaxID=2744239 RepID=A0A8J2BKM4_9BACT|nr:hypothetical protein [Candidatus Methylacidithermus pantelleriae]CAF0696932.1 conserved hypothetical protein [Candidatus Methylacidithermus pantelleriae]